MVSLYRTIGVLAALLGANIAAKILFPSIDSNFVGFNMVNDSIMVLGLLAILTDLNILKINGNGYKSVKGYLKIGVIALLAGTLWEILSFSSLLFGKSSVFIVSEWARIAPLVIGLIGLPVLLISDRVSKERLIFGINSTKWRGLIFNAVFCIGYTIVALIFLVKIGWLTI